MATRDQNERTFERWQAMPDGGRLYSFVVLRHHGWSARYLKEVDATETTIRFWQEIYDDTGRLVQVHQKFPVDLGHEDV